MAGDGASPTPVDLSSLSGEQWVICIAAATIFVAVVIINFALQNARRWRALSDIRLDVVPPGFRTLQDLPRVCLAFVLRLRNVIPAPSPGSSFSPADSLRSFRFVSVDLRIHLLACLCVSTLCSPFASYL
jgi:hypothetical protein